MNIIVKKLDDINIIMSGSIEDSVLREYIKTLRKSTETSLQNDKTIDEEMLKNKIKALDKDRFQREAESQILHDFIHQGMKEAKVKANETLGEPHFKTYEKRGDALYLEIEISTAPYIDTNVSYMDIVPSYTKVDIDTKTVTVKLEEMAVQQAPYVKIEQARAVQNEDQVIISFEGFLNGRLLEGASEENYALIIGSGSMMLGFEEQIIGMKPMQEKTIKISFPKDYKTKGLAGQNTEFKVTLHEILEKKIMGLNDALAQRIFSDDNATLAMLKERMLEKITAQEFSNIYNEKLKPALIKGLLTKFDFTLPNNVIEQEIDAKVNERAQRMSKKEHALYKEDEENFAALRVSIRKEAKDSIKAALIVDALAKKEGIGVDDKEVLSALQYQALMRGQNAEELVEYYKKNNLMTSAKVGLIEDKLFRKMLGVEEK